MSEEKEHDQKKSKEHHNSNLKEEDNREENKDRKSCKPQEKKCFDGPQLWQGLTAILGILFIISIFTGGFGGFASEPPNYNISVRCVNEGSGGAVAAAEGVPVAPQEPTIVDLEVGDSPVKGDANAPVTIIEFSDFECPFCERFYSQTLSQIEEEYVDTGKVRLAYKHLPLPFHPQAMPAALASECARDQGKFWEYHDLIFENQALLAQNKYKEWAGLLGLNQGEFDQCFDSKKHEERVFRDVADAERAGIGGTPTFLINGKVVSGALPFGAFKTEIDAELN